MLVICGGCQKVLNINDSLAGKLGRCPACEQIIKIPREIVTPEQGGLDVHARSDGGDAEASDSTDRP